MEIQRQLFLELLGAEDTRFVIPVFQRVYSWGARQCEELWEDLMNIGAAEQDEGAGNGPDTHFMGLLLYAPDAESWHGAAQLDVIDGQQRMTTMMLLLSALARHLDETSTHLDDGTTSEGILARFLRVCAGGIETGKLELSFMDSDTLHAIVGVEPLPEEPAGRLLENFELFYDKMQQPNFDVERLWCGIGRLEVAGVKLGHDDNPQLVFESLNSKGMALSTADRIRNYVVVADEAAGVSDGGLFERYWLPFEKLTRAAEGDFDATAVIDAWLAGKYREVRILDKSEVYGIFKSCLRSEYANAIEPLFVDLSAYARTFASDEEFRTQELENAQRWIAGKPKELISEYKMFGD